MTFWARSDGQYLDNVYILWFCIDFLFVVDTILMDLTGSQRFVVYAVINRVAHLNSKYGKVWNCKTYWDLFLGTKNCIHTFKKSCTQLGNRINFNANSPPEDIKCNSQIVTWTCYPSMPTMPTQAFGLEICKECCWVWIINERVFIKLLHWKCDTVIWLILADRTSYCAFYYTLYVVSHRPKLPFFGS